MSLLPLVTVVFATLVLALIALNVRISIVTREEAAPAGSQFPEIAFVPTFGLRVNDGALTWPTKPLPDSRLGAGKPNRQMFDRAVAERRLKTIYVQEAGWVAALEAGWRPDSTDSDILTLPTEPGRFIKRFHKHSDAYSSPLPYDPGKPRPPYVDTVDCAVCALAIMREVNAQRAVIITHKQQMQRALWDFQWVCVSYFNGRFSFVPLTGSGEYDSLSYHPWTRNAMFYLPFELLFSRPKDLMRKWWGVSSSCVAPP